LTAGVRLDLSAAPRRRGRRGRVNYARLNHILIPSTKEGRDRLRDTRFSRYVLGPLSRTYFALTDEGNGLLLLAVIASLVGLDVIRGQNYLLWAISFSLIVASLAVRPLFTLRGVAIEVRGPARVTVGDEARFVVTLSNGGARAHHSLRVRLPFLPWDGSWIDAGEAVRRLGPGEKSAVQVTGRFRARGHHHIDPFHVAALVPLGLVVGPSIGSRGTRFVVVPRIATVLRVEVPERPCYQPGGVALASFTGESMELVGLRPYRSGDRIRDLHAPSWARLGTPMVRQYQQEYFSRIGVVLDCDGEGKDEAALDAAVSLTAGIVRRLASGEALIDLFTFGGPPEVVTIGRSLGSFERALDRLADVEPGPAIVVDEGMEVLRPHLDHLSAVILVVPDWDAPRREWVERIRKTGVGCKVAIVSREPLIGTLDDPDVSRVSPESIEHAQRGGAGLVL
jgi:uncharacterized protein (DUF58 family)